MRFSLPIPKTEDDFEHLCCELLKRHWDRPQLQRYAHRGEDQEGIDIFDPAQTKPIRGGQCKLHGYGKTIPTKEIEEEVEKARKHTPALDHFTILTTAKKSKQADRKVAEINQAHQAERLFTVEVLTWDQIENLLEQHPEVRDPIYLTLPHQQATQIQSQLAALMLRVEAPSGAGGGVIDGELDAIKAELERHKLDLAWQMAERIETRHGDRLSDRQRWRVRSFQASVRLRQGLLEEAGSLLIAAKQYQPAEEKALVNEAIGYELLGESGRARSLAEQLRGSFPCNMDVVALWVRTAAADVSAERLEAEAGAFAATSENVALAVSICLLNRGELDGAERHARRATEIDASAPQGWLLLGQAVHMRGFHTRRAEERNRLLTMALEHYAKAEELAQAQGSAHLQGPAVLGRAIVRFLRGDPGAGDDFFFARRLDPRDAQVARRYAIYLAEKRDFERAVEQARASVCLERGGETQTVLAAVLWDRNRGGDRREALEMCLGLVAANVAERFDEALDMAVTGLIDTGRFAEVVPLLDGIPKERLSGVARIALLAQLHVAQGNSGVAEEEARCGVADVTEVTGAHDLRRLARVLVRLNLDALALPLLQRTANTARFDLDTQMLLDCANRVGMHQLVLELCRGLREAGEGDRRLLDNEIDLLQTYDRPAAIAVLQTYLAQHADDRLARLRLSGLALQSERPDLVTSDLSQLPAVEDAPPATIGRLVVAVLEWAGKWPEALAFAYDLLRRNFGDPDAHGLYCALFLHGESEGQTIASPEAVQPGTAVAYREGKESEAHWVVIEDNAPQAQLDEYPATHPRGQRLLGLRVGDEFLLAVPALQERYAAIVEIVSKYVFRFRDSIDQFQERFPDRAELQKVNLAREGGGEGDLDLTPVFASLDKRRQLVSQVQAAYMSQPTPLHVFAEMTGGHLFDALRHLTTTPDVGIRWCCEGSEQEREAARGVARDCRALVLDLTTLFAVWRLSLAELLREWPDRQFVVTQATFDRLRAIVEFEAAPGPRRHMVAGEQGGYAFHEVSEDQRAGYVRSLQVLLTFVRQRCALTPAPEGAALDSELRQRLTEMIGREGLESVIVAARPGHLLLTDDLTLAIIARDKFKSTRRAWTQVLLQVAVDEGVLAQEDFERQSARLIGLGYSSVWWTVGILRRAGELAEWKAAGLPLSRIIDHLRLPELPPQVKLELAAHTIVAMFVGGASPFARQLLIQAVLDRLGNRRLCQPLAARVTGLFGLDVIAAAEVLGVIRDWSRRLLVLP
jgi:tetratricopeptide (TPR) repeat protein